MLKTIDRTLMIYWVNEMMPTIILTRIKKLKRVLWEQMNARKLWHWSYMMNAMRWNMRELNVFGSDK